MAIITSTILGITVKIFSETDLNGIVSFRVKGNTDSDQNHIITVLIIDKSEIN